MRQTATQLTSGYRRLTGRPSGGVLLAEYAVGVLIICGTLVHKTADEGYISAMAQIMIRLTALTAVFFILFLAAGSENFGKAAAWFGLLIDLGILFTAVSEGTVKTLGLMLSGQPADVDETSLLKATDIKEPEGTVLPTPTADQLKNAPAS